MMVKVQLFAYLREVAGRGELELEGRDVHELLENLVAMFTTLSSLVFESYESRVINSDVMVLVNGKNIEALSGLGTELKKGDVVSVFPPICGG